MKVKSESEVAQLCLTLSDPMDCSPLCSPVAGIFQARVLEWVAIAFSVTALTYSFPNLQPVRCSLSGSNCCFLTCIQLSQETDKLVWYSHLLKNFPQFVAICIVKGFGVVNKAVDVFLELSCFFYDPTNVDNLISGSSAFSKSSLNIWKFSVHILLKPSLKDFEHYLASR